MAEIIRIENLTKKFGDVTALENVNLKMERGKIYGIVGRNGSGKSSILNLLLRLYEPDHGRILFDDTDISNIGLDEYRDLFGVMMQRAYLLNDTIRNNINIRGELSEQEIVQAAEIVLLKEYLAGLPDGMDTIVGYNGSKLSGGERQRIALARSLGKKCRILVLDEATANFDLKVEQSFHEYIRNTACYDFVFVVTHRLDVLKGMDRIFVFENGEIIESGSYQELCDKGIDIRQLLLKGEDCNGGCC